MTLVIILLAFSAFIGLMMELYKKSVRKDKAKITEIKLVAFLCSALFAFITYKVVIVNGQLNQSPFLIALYIVAIYLLQLPTCMAFWKPLLKKYLEGKVNG
jgi:hypothetical protein